jgi:hypothetical protein
MTAKGVSIRSLAIMLGVTYEQARRIVRGEAVPSKPSLKLISLELELDFNQLDRVGGC